MVTEPGNSILNVIALPLKKVVVSWFTVERIGCPNPVNCRVRCVCSHVSGVNVVTMRCWLSSVGSMVNGTAVQTGFLLRVRCVQLGVFGARVDTKKAVQDRIPHGLVNLSVAAEPN